MVGDYFITYLRDFADLILINAVLIMDFAQFLAYNFRVITALSFLIWQGSRDWDTSSGNPGVSEVVLVTAVTSLRVRPIIVPAILSSHYHVGRVHVLTAQKGKT